MFQSNPVHNSKLIIMIDSTSCLCHYVMSVNRKERKQLVYHVWMLCCCERQRVVCKAGDIRLVQIYDLQDMERQYLSWVFVYTRPNVIPDQLYSILVVMFCVASGLDTVMCCGHVDVQIIRTQLQCQSTTHVKKLVLHITAILCFNLKWRQRGQTCKLLP